MRLTADREGIAGKRSPRTLNRVPTDSYAGDTIVVPLNAGRVRPQTLWLNVTRRLSYLGVAVAAFNSAEIF